MASEASRTENEGIIGHQINRLSHHVMIGLNDGHYPTLRAANRVDEVECRIFWYLMATRMTYLIHPLLTECTCTIHLSGLDISPLVLNPLISTSRQYFYIYASPDRTFISTREPLIGTFSSDTKSCEYSNLNHLSTAFIELISLQNHHV